MMLFIIGLIVGANVAVLFLSLCMAATDGSVTAPRHGAKPHTQPRALWDQAA